MTFDQTLRVYGSGSPIVLIPGFAGNHRHWAYQIAELKNSFKLICIDNILINNCFVISSDFLIDKAVSYIYEMLHLSNIEHVHLLGHSMGAMIASEFANKYPNKILSLILSSLPINTNQDNFETPVEKLSYLLVNNDVKQFYIQLLPYMFSSGFKETPHYRMIESLIEKNTQYEDPNAMLLQIKSIKRWKKSILNKNIIRPDLVIYGDEDTFVSTDMKDLRKIFPMSKIEIINNAGHAVHIEKAKEFNMIIHQFIKEKTQS